MNNDVKDYLLNEYNRLYDFYLEEMKSRRDFLKWYSPVIIALFPITSYLWSKVNEAYAMVFVSAIIILGISVLRVLIGSTIVIDIILEKKIKIQNYFISCLPEIKPISPRYTIPRLHGNQFGKFPIFKLKMGYILIIDIIMNSILISMLGWMILSHFALIECLTLLLLAILCLFLLSFIGQKIYIIIKLCSIKGTIEFINNN